MTKKHSEVSYQSQSTPECHSSSNVLGCWRWFAKKVSNGWPGVSKAVNLPTPKNIEPIIQTKKRYIHTHQSPETFCVAIYHPSSFWLATAREEVRTLAVSTGVVLPTYIHRKQVVSYRCLANPVFEQRIWKVNCDCSTQYNFERNRLAKSCWSELINTFVVKRLRFVRRKFSRWSSQGEETAYKMVT